MYIDLIWFISIENIAKESPWSERILNIIAFFDNKGIPFELIKASIGSTCSENKILLAISRLTDYSFLQVQRAVDEGMPTYEQHRLVQLATRCALSEAQFLSFSGEALKIMTDLFPIGTHETRNSCILYLPHALKTAKRRQAEGYQNQAPLLLQHMGRYY
ncbi:hypothetical protein BTUL_0137g00350 [Botrytis tulipae]|uniref:Uncharacterized protein n=1 Tax=Botrytis tulipae TaxID=87230 RepID=A0A4Z1EIJ8_9HELO|nr:hypothetical protein BTUL_0137g00350 [Botrytis tulipae]